MTRLAAALLALGLALCACAAEAKPPKRYTPHEVRTILEDILARPEYHNPLTGLAEMLEAFVERIVRALRKLFEGISGPSGLIVTAPLLYWLIVGVCVVVLVLLLSHIGYTLYHAIAVEGRAVDDEQEPRERPQRPAELLAQAEQLAAQGRYVDAIRLLLRALALEMQRRGRSFVFTSLTNREFAATFSSDPSVFERLRTFVDLLDDRWYGRRPCDERDYALCRTVYDHVLASARA